MTDCVIFGRSPFVNQVDCVALAARFHTIAINQAPCRVNTLFSLWDAPPDPAPADQVFVHWESNHPGTKIATRGSHVPFLNGETRDGFPAVAWIAFSVSAVVNWCLIQGFERIYLVGVDHVDSDGQFKHWDASQSPKRSLLSCCHQDLKRFIAECSKYAEIYQTNPTVAPHWPIPFKSISSM